MKMTSRRIRVSLQAQQGQASTEYLVVFVILFVALIFGGSAVLNYPALADKSTLLLIAVAFLAGIGWSAKQLIASLNTRAQLIVFEILSKNSGGLERKQIETAVYSDHFIFRFVPGLAVDALAHLVSENTVTATDGLFRLAQKS